MPGVCDVCGSTQFKRRADDNEEAVRTRMAEYRAKTAPILPHYEAQGIVGRVDGMAPMDAVSAAIATILDGAYLCAHAALPHLIASGGGSIVNIGGLSSYTGAARRAHVIAAKAGLVGLTRALLDRATKGVKAVVIGGGLLGLEAARGLQVQGCEVTVVHLMDTLMERQVDLTGGGYLKTKMECLGMKVLLERNTATILGDGKVEGIAFKDGNCIEAEIVVIAAGCLLKLAVWEWVAIVLCIGLVISSECMNTALERLADRVSGEMDPLIKQAKDCSSAAVLVLAMTSAVVGSIVFVPKISAWMGW